jgi:hypothetical protein
LQCYANFSLDPADGLLKRTGEHRVWGFDANRILQLAVGIEHGSLLRFELRLSTSAPLITGLIARKLHSFLSISF